MTWPDLVAFAASCVGSILGGLLMTGIYGFGPVDGAQYLVGLVTFIAAAVCFAWFVSGPDFQRAR